MAGCPMPPSVEAATGGTHARDMCAAAGRGRPAASTLKCNRLKTKFGLTYPLWATPDARSRTVLHNSVYAGQSVGGLL